MKSVKTFTFNAVFV